MMLGIDFLPRSDDHLRPTGSKQSTNRQRLMVWVSFIFFTGFVAVVTYFLTRNDDHESSKGYFLAGRRLTGPFIAGSLLLTNLSTEQMVGLNGSTFKNGLSVMAWEVVAVLALVLMALFFLPRFLKSGITTVPQFLEERFDHGTRTITTLIFLFAYVALLLPIILYSGAMGLSSMLNLEQITGIQEFQLAYFGMVSPKVTITVLTVWLVGIIGSIYALFGGLRTVAVSDTLNGIGLLIGGLLITYFGLQYISDGEGLFRGFEILKEKHPEKLNSIAGSKDAVPFSTLFTGVVLLNVFYWCTNQQIIQRTFGAKNLKEGQKGVLICGAFKLLGPLYLVLPGILAYSWAMKNNSPVIADEAYGTLVREVLPTYLTGFFAAVMVGAILSSFNSALNSSTTLFSLGVYKSFINKNATDEQTVRAGKKFGWIIAVIAMGIAPMLIGKKSIFEFLQDMNGIYAIPIFSVVVVGMLTRRVPAVAAKLALVVGFLILALVNFEIVDLCIDSKFESFHFFGITFASLVGLMLLIGKLRPLAEPWQHKHSGDVDITPWKYAKPVSLVLAILVILIYASFADFSVLSQ